MEKTEYCNFAHGKSGLRLSLCKYDTYCSNSECNFSHSIPNGRNRSNKNYDLIDFVVNNNNKRNKKVKKIKDINPEHTIIVNFKDIVKQGYMGEQFLHKQKTTKV